MRNKYHKDTFDKIPPAKRRRILQVAVREFSRHGYEAVSINQIAEKADISVGSIYTYFNSKRDLFLTVAAEGYKMILDAESEFKESTGSLKGDLKVLFSMTIRYAQKYSNMFKLKLLLSTEELASMSPQMATHFDTSFLHIYHKLLGAAIERGELRQDLDLNLASWMIDNMVDSLQMAFSNRYHKRRLVAYLGIEETVNIDQLVESLVDCVYKGLN